MLTCLVFQTRASETGIEPTSDDVNGELSALTLAEVHQLRTRVDTLTRKLEATKQSEDEYAEIAETFQSAMKTMMQKLRQYAYDQQMTIIDLHRHYRGLLDVERTEKLQLMLDWQEWQRRLVKANEYARKMMECQGEIERPLLERVAELNRENRVMRRVLGWEIEESEGEDEEDGAGQQRADEEAGAGAGAVGGAAGA